MTNRVLLLVLFGLLQVTISYKILGLFPLPAKSHVDVFLPLMKALAKKGHEVTVVSHFPLKEPIPGYSDIALDSPISLLQALDLNTFKGRVIERYRSLLMLEYFGRVTCRDSMESPNLKEFVRQNHTFDLIIAEFFNSDCLLGLVHKYKAPLVGLSSCSVLHWTNERFGNPTHPAYIPNIFLGTSDHLTFLERVENTLIGVINQLFYDWIVTPNDQKVNREYFGDDIPPLRTTILNSSLLIVNTHFSYNLPRPYVPAIIEVGGIHIGQTKKLPENLEKWINESTHGVIYFSLGSMIKGHTFPDQKRRAFLNAFGRLSQRVLWKWENDTMPEKPENVMIQKWMPQLDILCHPNVVAFISHGGLLGTTEAVHCGVPIVVMPQYGDQHTNARAIEATGGGVILKLHEADEEQIYEALTKVLDPNFRKGAKELSARFRDRPLPPLETAIYWVEYVARHRGAHHMRTAAVDMPFYKYFLLDVLAFLLAVFAVWALVSFYVLRAVLRKVFGKKLTRSKTD